LLVFSTPSSYQLALWKQESFSGTSVVIWEEACVTMCLRGGSIRSSMTKLIFSALLIFLIVVSAAASDPEDAVANAVAIAFLQVRQAAHLSKLERMGKNTFRGKVCNKDMRFPSGWINDVVYETSDPAHLPESAQRLATWPDSSKVTARFGLGVCLLSSSSLGQPKYSVLIATYESRRASLWRIFWE
jgi:hypothetical protein